MCQRLVPKLCPECAQPARDSQRHQPHLFAWQQLFGQQAASLQARSERGCKACHGTGIAGQSVVAEIIVLDSAARQFIIQQDFAAGASLRSVGWESYRDNTKVGGQWTSGSFDAQKVVGELVSHHQPVISNTTNSINAALGGWFEFSRVHGASIQRVQLAAQRVAFSGRQQEIFLKTCTPCWKMVCH